MKHLKSYTLYETTHEEIMSIHYGVNVISECNSIIDDIKDMLLELDDTGLHTSVGYTPMTLTYAEQSPKIAVEISTYVGTWGGGRFLKGDTDYSFDVREIVKRIKDYVRSKGYSAGSGEWESNNRQVCQILIQK